MRYFIDMTGERYGRVIVLGRLEGNSDHSSRWRCRCELCGRELEMSRKSLLYREGKDLGCGCTSKRKAPTQRSDKKGGETLCWTCDLVGKSICPWDREFKPVSGWEAEKVRLWLSGQDKYVESYLVINCPMKE